MIISIF